MTKSQVTNPNKTIVAKASFVQASPRKLRWIVDAVAKKQPLEAIDYLKMIPNRAAAIVLKVYQQAMGNAKNNFKLSPSEVTLGSVQVHEGPRYKKRDVHAHGARFDSGLRHKRRAHITVELVARKEQGGAKS